jgi:hypothetical protein
MNYVIALWYAFESILYRDRFTGRESTTQLLYFTTQKALPLQLTYNITSLLHLLDSNTTTFSSYARSSTVTPTYLITTSMSLFSDTMILTSISSCERSQDYSRNVAWGRYRVENVVWHTFSPSYSSCRFLFTVLFLTINYIRGSIWHHTDFLPALATAPALEPKQNKENQTPNDPIFTKPQKKSCFFSIPRVGTMSLQLAKSQGKMWYTLGKTCYAETRQVRFSLREARSKETENQCFC